MPRNPNLATYKKGAVLLVPSLLVAGSLGLRACLRLSVAQQRSEEHREALEERSKAFDEEQTREKLAAIEERARERAAEAPKAEGKARPAVLATGQHGPDALAVDATHAYWLSAASGEVLRAPRAGDMGDRGAPTVLASKQALDTPRHAPTLALDGSGVYWATSGTLAKKRTDAAVMRVAKAGGEATEVLGGLTRPVALAVQGGSVFWIEGADEAGNGGGSVMKAPKAGGKPVTLANAEKPCALAVDDTSVYWVEQARAVLTVNRTPKAGGDTETLFAATGRLGCSLAVDGASLYWIDRAGDAVMRADKRGQGAVKVAVLGERLAVLALDGKALYALAEGTRGALDGSGTVWRVASDGASPPVALATEEVGLNALAVAADELVWTRWSEQDGDGAVVHAPK